jgi:hypothetical protein
MPSAETLTKLMQRAHRRRVRDCIQVYITVVVFMLILFSVINVAGTIAEQRPLQDFLARQRFVLVMPPIICLPLLLVSVLADGRILQYVVMVRGEVIDKHKKQMAGRVRYFNLYLRMYAAESQRVNRDGRLGRACRVPELVCVGRVDRLSSSLPVYDDMPIGVPVTLLCWSDGYLIERLN